MAVFASHRLSNSNVVSTSPRSTMKLKKAAVQNKGKGKENIPDIPQWEGQAPWVEEVEGKPWEWRYLNDFSSSKVPPLFSKDGRWSAFLSCPMNVTEPRPMSAATSSVLRAYPSRFSQSPAAKSSLSSFFPPRGPLERIHQGSRQRSSTLTTFFNSSPPPSMEDY